MKKFLISLNPAHFESAATEADIKAWAEKQKADLEERYKNPRVTFDNEYSPSMPAVREKL